MAATLPNPFSPAELQYQLQRMTGETGSLTISGDPDIGGCQVSSTTWPDATILAAYLSLPYNPRYPGKPAGASTFLTVGQTKVDVSGAFNGDLGAAVAAEGAGKEYIVSASSVTTNGSQINLGSNTTVRAAGKTATVLEGGVADGAILSVEGSAGANVENVVIEDLTIDSQNVPAASGLGLYYVSGLTLRRVAFTNTAFKHVQNYVGSQSTLDNQDLVFEDCSFGASSATGTTEAITLANTERVRFLRCLWDLGVDQTDVLMYQLLDHVSFEDCAFDTAPVYSLSCKNIAFARSSLPGLGGANLSDHGAFGYDYVDNLTTLLCSFSGQLNLGSTRGYRDLASTFEKTPQSPVAFQPTSGQLVGYDSGFLASVFRSNNTSGYAWGVFYLPDSNADLGLRVRGCVFDDDQTTPTQGSVFNLTNALTYSGVHIEDSEIRNGAFVASGNPYQAVWGNSPGSVGPNCSARGVKYFNPLGALPTTAGVPTAGKPAIPVSGSEFANTYGVDCTVHVAGGTVTEIAVAGVSTGLTSGAFRVPAGQTIMLVYTAAPSWVWIGD